jgi:outer membrane protein assembly factor BamA
VDWIRSIGIWLSFFLWWNSTSIAQEHPRQRFEINVLDSLNPKIEHKINRAKKKSGNADELKSALSSMAYKEGYLLHEISQIEKTDTIVFSLYLSEVYRWSTIEMDEEAAGVFRKADVDVDRLMRKPVSSARIGRSLNKSLAYLENNGFPFAKLYLDDVSIEGGYINCQIKIEKGPLVKIDSLIVQGDLQVREAYIANYLGLKEGGLYNERSIRKASAELSEVAFINEFRPLDVRFNKSETKVTLYLNRNRASRFDGIIGFLPDDKTGKLLITGDVALHLENALKQGEIIDLNWRKLQSNTQDLEAKAVLPYVFNSPLGPDARIKIYRRDTLFTDVFGQFGLRYVFQRNNYLRAFIDRQTTNLITTKQYEGLSQAPPYLDRNVLSYGLGVKYMKLDYLLNPAKGVEFEGEAGVGNKNIEINQNLPPSIYDNLDLNSVQFKSNVNMAYYVSIVPRLVWHQRCLAASIMNGQLFNNEAYRIGGFRTMRGFNEESIFATTYAIGRSELRYQIEKNGFLFVHFDQAWYENTSFNKLGVRRDTPYAFGAGISIGTKAGVFSFSSALGSQQGNPILIRTAKFHFGFLSVF